MNHLCKITYIISDIDKALAFEWVATKINSEKFDISFILLNPESSAIEDFLRQKKILVYNVPFHSKKDYPKAIFKLYRILKKLQPNVIHSHMRDADFLGQIAGWILKIPKRVMTRHYSTLNHVYYPKGVKWDKYIQRFPTHIVAISEVVKLVLINEGVSEGKINLIPHGFDLDSFYYPDEEKVKNLKSKYNPFEKRPVIGVIARYVELKGHQYIIEAFSKLLKDEPNAFLMLANASGPMKQEINKILMEYLPAGSYLEIPFEDDIQSLYHLFDVFIHVPTDSEIEAFGQTYIEALAAGIPSVFTLSGIAHEFIENEKNALVVPYKDFEAIHKAICNILTNEKLRKKLEENGLSSVKRFSLQLFIEELEKLYEA